MGRTSCPLSQHSRFTNFRIGSKDEPWMKTRSRRAFEEITDASTGQDILRILRISLDLLA
jgi:hypothetical protein